MATAERIDQARYRLQGFLDANTSETGDLGEFGTDLNILLEITAPKPQTQPGVESFKKLRVNDPDTSFEAAISQTTEKAQALYGRIWLVLDEASRTDEEIYNEIYQFATASGARTRRSELVDAGWVRDSGERRPTITGSNAIVWELAPRILPF